MVIDKVKELLLGIFIVLILLFCFISIDYGDPTVSNSVKSVDTNDTNQVFLLNESESNLTVKSDDKIHIVKQEVKKELPTITITTKPSVNSGYAYRWYTTTWIDYCPHCHRYGVLYNAHKWEARFEQELTCESCGADYCGVVGKEKYIWSNVYLRRA